MSPEQYYITQINKGLALATAGNAEQFNAMTIGWGSLGTLWSKTVATIYIKPCRYTHEFLEREQYFTVALFDEKYRRAMALLGTKSGRDCNKVAETGLTPKFLENGVTFDEAELTFVCHKLYSQQLDAASIPQFALERYYQTEAPHTVYVGEIVAVLH